MNNLFIVDEELFDIRIDRYLSELLPDVSRSFIQKLLKDNEILLNDKPVKANYKVQPSDKININIPKPVEANIIAENIPLDIIYEDDDFLIVNKPKDMVVHPAPGHYTGTLVNGLMYHCKNHLSNINGVLRPGIVHRIDKDTTGALIICKNDYSHNFIACLQTGCSGRTVFNHGRNSRIRIFNGYRFSQYYKHDTKNQNSSHQIHERTSSSKNHALPNRTVLITPRFRYILSSSSTSSPSTRT